MKVNLPMEFDVPDYHEFESICYALNKILKNEVNPEKPAVAFIEVGMWDRNYHAYFHDANHKPTKKEVLEFYMESQKNNFKTTKDLKEYFESGWLDKTFLDNLQDVVDDFSMRDGFLKVNAKTKKLK